MRSCSVCDGRTGIWNRKIKASKVIDSNGGFLLNDKPTKAPDFVLELVSDLDNLNDVNAKMGKWLENGVWLAVLVDWRTALGEYGRWRQQTGTTRDQNCFLYEWTLSDKIFV